MRISTNGFELPYSMLVNPIDFRLHYAEQLKARGVKRQGLIDAAPSQDD